MPERATAVISSTVRDLPEHRKQVMDACLREDFFPKMMEHLPASPDDAIEVSLDLVDQADVYLGVFAHRYGYVPEGHDRSISAMEYERALERSIPRLIFLMDPEHLVRPADVETGPGAERLAELKARLEKEQVVWYFRSAEDLRAIVVQSLSKLRERDFTSFHYARDIPSPPTPYVAHPYTLLQTRDVVGRAAELNLLTDWVAKPSSEVHQARIFSLVAMGGMGKSALTWKWFNEIAPHEMQPLAGRMWWSFYESDASFDNFLTQALAYVTAQPTEEVARLSRVEREDRLFVALDTKPFLVVLDGFERVLTAYARPDAAHLSDEGLDQRTENLVSAGLLLMGQRAALGRNPLRRTTDVRVGAFLRRLAAVHGSRILISTRLYPADLQTPTRASIPGAFAYTLGGLTDDDALTLWRESGVSGSRAELLDLFRTFENYPLLVTILAGEIARFREAPGDLTAWRTAHPDFDPFALPLVQRRAHVMLFALAGLSERQARLLQTVAAFRMPTTFDTLTALLLGEGKPYPTEAELDADLTDLEDRGLLGWDRRGNRYDLHPVVRGVAWSGMDRARKHDIYNALASHFESIPEADLDSATSPEDLVALIELFNTLVQLERLKEAWRLFDERLSGPLVRMGRWDQLGELLDMLIEADLEAHSLEPDDRDVLLFGLAISCQFRGEPGRAVSHLRQLAAKVGLTSADDPNVVLDFPVASALLATGSLREVESLVGEDISDRQQSSFEYGALHVVCGAALACRGLREESSARTTLGFMTIAGAEDDLWLFLFLPELLAAQAALWRGELDVAMDRANQALGKAHEGRNVTFEVEARVLQAAVRRRLGDYDGAADGVVQTLELARNANVRGPDAVALVELAELHRLGGDLDAARAALEEAAPTIERGPFRLVQADAANILAQLERDAGNLEAARASALEAYRAAWCDGPPYVYAAALETARRHLTELGAELPDDLQVFSPGDGLGKAIEGQAEPDRPAEGDR